MDPVKNQKIINIIPPNKKHRVEFDPSERSEKDFREVLTYVVKHLPHSYLNTQHYPHICSDMGAECTLRYPDEDWTVGSDRRFCQS
ncbi:MAG: hypothetical protein VXX85_03640, partial [Candidatus Margulisiibacteriota bacterium]|nr:hypothetical protein [Candidatus Margulisiibacteriota bacterium]